MHNYTACMHKSMCFMFLLRLSNSAITKLYCMTIFKAHPISFNRHLEGMHARLLNSLSIRLDEVLVHPTGLVK